MTARALVAMAFALVGCGRDARRDLVPADVLAPPRADARATLAPSATVELACGLPAQPWRFPAVERVVAVGDVHGDLAATEKILRAAGVVDDAGRWRGGTTWVVQGGDLLDRGDDEQAIVDWFERLEAEAAAAGGRFLWLLGNHELMNAALDFRYVTPGARTDFDDAPGVDPKAGPADAPPELRGRIAALAPGGAYAKVMAEQNVWTIVGDTLFAHAGMAGPWTTQLGLANRSARCWLAGKGEAAPPPVFTDDEGPLWTRVWGGDEVDCDAFKAALGKLGVARMVVGHTVQASGANSKCDGALWRIDVGLSKFYGDNPIQVLEIAGDRAQVVTGKRAP